MNHAISITVTAIQDHQAQVIAKKRPATAAGRS
jgi:hypothetical protein